jgi:malic enzyme
VTTGDAPTPVPAQRFSTHPAARARPERVAGAVAVVSDGSGLRHRGRTADPASVHSVLAEYTELIHDLTGLPAHPLMVTATDDDHLAASLRGLPADIGAIALTHTDPARARAAQQTLRAVGGLPVVTDEDTTAIALAAAVLTSLARAGSTPLASKVVIAGAEHLPGMCALLMAVGIGDIVSWREADAHVYPLYRVVHGADVVIDLLGAARELTGATVITPDDPAGRLLALPGLLSAVVQTPVPVLDVSLYRVCALALAASTPRDRLLPDLADPAVTDNIAHAATQALHRPRSHR